jgi:hypothetical protein
VGHPRPPATLFWAVLLLRVQAVALVLLAVALVVLTVLRRFTSLPFALLTIGLVLAVAALTWVLAAALTRRRVRARAPAIVLELMLLYPVWLDLGAIRLLPAAFLVAVCVLLILPPTNRALVDPSS